MPTTLQSVVTVPLAKTICFFLRRRDPKRAHSSSVQRRFQRNLIFCSSNSKRRSKVFKTFGFLKRKAWLLSFASFRFLRFRLCARHHGHCSDVRRLRGRFLPMHQELRALRSTARGRSKEERTEENGKKKRKRVF